MKSLQGMRIHFVGINGTSMSGLMMLSAKLGAITSGSDKVDGEYFKILKDSGMNVYQGVNRQIAENSDLVVFSGAIPKNHPEIIESHSMERGEFLGFLSSFFEKTIAIAGTHGKTTVTAMICHALKMLKKDFSFTFGGIDSETNANWGFFGRKLLVLEACEYRDSFLSLNPTISVVTSLEYDHPDYFENFDSLKKSFSKFASKTKETLILGNNVDKVLECTPVSVRTLAFDKNFYISHFNHSGECIFVDNGEEIHLKINLIGESNLFNACLAYRVLKSLGLESKDILTALSSFKGVMRRQEFLGYFEEAKCFSDYAHHPTQIKALLQSFDTLPSVKVVFEPHTYSRTKSLMNEFSTCFDKAEEVIILPVYEARETYDKEGDSETLFDRIKNKNKYFANSYSDATNYLEKIIKKDDILLFVGAGTIDDWARKIVSEKGLL